jgi:hypothetical protein
MNSHKRKFQECVDTFQQQLKKLKEDTPIEETEHRQQITLLLDTINKINPSPVHFYSRYGGYCNSTEDDETDIYHYLDFEFEDQETFDKIKEDPDHPTIVDLFNQFFEDNYSCTLRDNQFDSIENFHENAEDPIFVPRDQAGLVKKTSLEK